MSIKGQEKAALNAVLKGLGVYDKFMESSCKGYDFTNCSFGKGGIVVASKGTVTELAYDTTDPYLKGKNCFLSTEIGNLNYLTGMGFGNMKALGDDIDILKKKGYLKGTIPTEIGNLTKLEYFFSIINDLTGSIPTEIGHIKSLSALVLLNNKISGEIPSEIGNLKGLVSLLLDSNNLKGKIPTEIANLSNLTGLPLNNNYLSGPIPTEIGKLKGLGGLVLNNNYLSGEIPTEIGKLKGLRGLFLNNNCLSINSGGIKAIKSLDVYNKGTICPYKADPFWVFSCRADYNYNFDNNCIEKGVLKGITNTN